MTQTKPAPRRRAQASIKRTIAREYRERELLAKARDLAKIHLAGYEDKAGKPVFDHVERVASRMSSTVEKTVAYLHDLVEDSPTYSRERLKRDFPAKIAAAVLAMTRDDKSADYMTYIRRLAANPLAKKVKLADLADNLDRNRVIPDKALAKELQARYREAREFLLASKGPQNTEHP